MGWVLNLVLHGRLSHRPWLPRGRRLRLALVVQKELFAPQATTVAAKLTVLLDDAMARDHNRHAVVTVGPSNSPACSRFPHSAGQGFIGNRLTVRDPPKLPPHRFLERRPRTYQRDGELGQLTFKVAGKLVFELLEMTICSGDNGSIKPFAQDTVTMHLAWRPRPGGSPNTCLKASRNPLLDSNPYRNPTSSMSAPRRSSPSAKPMRRAR
jgi:hypothetical protein